MPNKRAATSSASISPLPDLSPLGEEDDEAEEEDDDDADDDVAAKAELFMRRLKRVMFDMDDAADDEVDDSLQQLKCPDEYVPEVWAGLSLKEQVAWYDNDDAQGVAAGLRPPLLLQVLVVSAVGFLVPVVAPLRCQHPHVQI